MTVINNFTNYSSFAKSGQYSWIYFFQLKIKKLFWILLEFFEDCYKIVFSKYDRKNHSNKSKPSEIDRKQYNKGRREYWKRQFPDGL